MSVYLHSDRDQLLECLNSIINQTLQPDEVIIVKDGLLKFDLNLVISDCGIDNVIIIDNKKNLGLPKSLNKGLLHCSNEFVFRMDTDDVCLKNRFKVQLERIVSNEDIAVLGSNVELIDDNSVDIIKNRNVPISDTDIRKIMPYKNPFNHPSVVFRKSLIQKVGGYSDLYLYEDWFLWFKLSQLEDVKFENMSQKLLKYRIRTFSDRRGIKIMKAEYSFYLRLMNENFINRKVFAINVFMKFVVRLLPSFIYKFFKHKFDELG